MCGWRMNGERAVGLYLDIHEYIEWRRQERNFEADTAQRLREIVQAVAVIAQSVLDLIHLSRAGAIEKVVPTCRVRDDREQRTTASGIEHVSRTYVHAIQIVECAPAR